MKTLSSLFIITLMFLFSCKKSEDPAASAGCTVTFKGTNYSLSTVACGTASGTQTLGGTAANQLLNVYKGGVLGDQVTFTLNIKTGDSYSTIDSGITPTVTISGKTWTFSGTVENDDGIDAQISGKCTCMN
jgi:hypothetical protein